MGRFLCKKESAIYAAKGGMEDYDEKMEMDCSDAIGRFMLDGVCQYLGSDTGQYCRAGYKRGRS